MTGYICKLSHSIQIQSLKFYLQNKTLKAVSSLPGAFLFTFFPFPDNALFSYLTVTSRLLNICSIVPIIWTSKRPRKLFDLANARVIGYFIMLAFLGKVKIFRVIESFLFWQTQNKNIWHKTCTVFHWKNVLMSLSVSLAVKSLSMTTVSALSFVRYIHRSGWRACSHATLAMHPEHH